MPRLSTDLIRYRIGIAAQEGANPAAIIQSAGAPPSLMSGDPEFVDGPLEREIWRAIVQHTGREDIGLVCGSRFPTQVMTLIGYVMANAPTIRVAFEKFCNYQRIIGDSMGIEIHRDDDTSTIKIQQWSEWHDALRYTVDVMMAAIPGWASANAPRPIKPIRVGFRYERPMDTEPYDTMFAPAPVTFGADTSFQIYDNSVLDQPVMGANNDMFSHFEDKAKILLNDYEGRDSYAFKARQFIARKLQGETPTVNELARELAVSVRKLQSELATEGTKFSILLNEVRRDLAIKYLRESSVSKAEIAYLLGYSEMSVFSRSFKKWTGLTPSEFQDRE